ncbi:hypothetical protein SprV_0100176800 [Sparganum proliferum]
MQFLFRNPSERTRTTGGQTDHRLVISKMRLRLQPRRRPEGKRPLDNPRSNRSERRTALVARELARYKVDIAAHSRPGSRNKVNWRSNQPSQRPEELPAPDENISVETRWCQLRDAVHSINPGVLGRARRQHQHWLDENDAAINKLLAERSRLHRAYLDSLTDADKAASYRCRRLAQQRLREMQGTWMVHKVQEIQGYADHNESNNIFVAINAMYDPSTKGTVPFSSSDGSVLLTERSQILKR